MSLLETVYYGNTLRNWMLAPLIALGMYAILGLIKRLLIRYLGRFASHTSSTVDDIGVELIANTRWFSMLAIGLFAGTRLLKLPARLDQALQVGAILIFLIQVGLWGNVAIGAFISRYVNQRLQEQDPAHTTTIKFLGLFGRFVLWVILVLVALDNVGVDITAFVAGLGVGGVAVALAVQSILGDLFGSLSIVLDKPFVVGDFIIVGDMMGTVESIGVKTTRVRSLSGEQLVFANSDLLGSRIRNFKRMAERRVVFSVGVAYETPVEKIEQIPGWLQEFVASQPKTRFDRAHFQRFGASSLDFEVVYYMLEPDFNLSMDTQQAINLAILRKFEAERISIAYPTQTLHVQAAPATMDALRGATAPGEALGGATAPGEALGGATAAGEVLGGARTPGDALRGDPEAMEATRSAQEGKDPTPG